MYFSLWLENLTEISNSLSASQRNVVRSKEIGIVTRVGGNGNERAFIEENDYYSYI